MSTALCTVNDGNTLASGGFDAAIRFWDAETGDEISSITGHTDLV